MTDRTTRLNSNINRLPRRRPHGICFEILVYAGTRKLAHLYARGYTDACALENRARALYHRLGMGWDPEVV